MTDQKKANDGPAREAELDGMLVLAQAELRGRHRTLELALGVEDPSWDGLLRRVASLARAAGDAAPRVTCRGVDVTEHVAAMFDALVGSLDWGSGFLSAEEIESVLVVAEVAGFDVPEFRYGAVDPPGLAPFAPEPFPESTRAPAGGWPSDRPEVWERAQAEERAYAERQRARRDAHDGARAEALRAWREQVRARARALLADAEVPR